VGPLKTSEARIWPRRAQVEPAGLNEAGYRYDDAVYDTTERCKRSSNSGSNKTSRNCVLHNRQSFFVTKKAFQFLYHNVSPGIKSTADLIYTFPKQHKSIVT
jgi:hypothetical protein